jgi:LacI family transcriptional regulator
VAIDRPQIQPPATLRDVAALAGVHTTTASRALNSETRGLVNGDTAQRVVEAATQLGYRSNPLARGLKTNRSYTIGVVVPDLRNPIFPPIARGIEDQLERSGYTSLLANTDNDPERERLSFSALRARQVDGFITATARGDHGLLQELAAAGVPIVLVNRGTDDGEFAQAVPDDHGGARAAVEHLAGLGHRRIAHFAVPTMSTGRNRQAGYLDAMAAAGLEVDPGLVLEASAYVEAEGARCARELLAARSDVTAVFAGNDLMALGCIDALRVAGLDCPGDVSVVGVNDMAWCDRFSPPLTTVHVPLYALGTTAADLLLERLRDPARSPERSVVLPTELIVRGSTATPRTAGA